MNNNVSLENLNNTEIFLMIIQEIFESKVDAKRAQQNHAYMKYKFTFIGMLTKERRGITQKMVKAYPFKDMKEVTYVVKKLWGMEKREYHLAAIQLLASYKKIWDGSTINLILYCMVRNSWWDSVDNLNAECLSHFYLMYPQETYITKYWYMHKSIWMQRSSIIFQKSYKEKTDVALLSENILNASKSTNFFIQKAIGWALREYAKTNKEWVIDFVANNNLPALSKREAIKHLG